MDLPFLDIPVRTSDEEGTMQKNLGLAFRSHMSAAAEREPILSRDAERLLQRYFLLRRPARDGVGSTVLSSMVDPLFSLPLVTGLTAFFYCFKAT
jgi:hypothetical protein